MKIVSVMTTSSSGGAEFATVEMLDALRERGHETVLLTDMPGIGRDTGVQILPIDIGPKLSKRTWASLAAQSPLLMRRLIRALSKQEPYDVLLVHFKKEQLLASMLPKRLRRTLVWDEWGPVPFPLRKGLPRRAYLAAAKRVALVLADLRRHPPVGHRGRRRSVQGGRRPERAAHRRDRVHRAGARARQS